MKSKLKIVFAGTPEIARRCLNDILMAGFQVDLVMTQPDRPSGRGMKLKASPVKELASLHNIEVLQPQKIKNNIEIFDRLNRLNPDIIVVVAYGLILPPEFLAIPKLGCVNIHVSLLPRHRGAAPIARSILSGDNKTGVTIMQMDEGLDTGSILLQQEIDIDINETSLSLHDKLSILGGKMIVDYLNNYQSIIAVPQPENGVTYANKIVKSEAEINWNETAQIIERKIRGYNPAPIAYTYLNGSFLKVWRARVANYKALDGFAHGDIIGLKNDVLVVACGDKTVLEIQELQIAGDKVKSAKVFAQARHDLKKLGT